MKLGAGPAQARGQIDIQIKFQPAFGNAATIRATTNIADPLADVG